MLHYKWKNLKQEIVHEQTTCHFMKLVCKGVNVANGCSFEGVTAVLFVAALNYCEYNSMIESIHLFYSISNAKWCRKTEMILFVNKDDLFQLCISDDIPLSFCFCAENGCKARDYTVIDELTGGGGGVFDTNKKSNKKNTKGKKKI